MQTKVMNSKETKQLLATISEQFGYDGKLDFVFLLHEKKLKVSVFSRDLAGLDLDGLRVDTMGSYFGAWFKERFRLSIEGTQLIGPACTRNVVEITKQEMQRWLLGEDLPLARQPPGTEQGAFVILKCDDDYLGCGKLTETSILNYIPKSRYVHALYEE